MAQGHEKSEGEQGSEITIALAHSPISFHVDPMTITIVLLHWHSPQCISCIHAGNWPEPKVFALVLNHSTEFVLTGISSIYFRWAQINGRDLQSNLVTRAVCDPLGTLKRACLGSHHHFISLQMCSGWGATNNLNTECISAVLFMYSSVILWDERCHRTVNLCHCHYYLNWCFFNTPGSDI